MIESQSTRHSLSEVEGASEPAEGEGADPGARWVRLGLCGMGLGLVALVARSLVAPRIHDAALMEFIAWRIREGDVPYRDLLDMNLPGTYLLHVLGQSVMGVGDVQLHVMDLVVMGVAGWAIWTLLRAFPTSARLLAVALALLLHLWRGGAYDTFERDWVMAAMALAVAALLSRPYGGAWRVVLAGGIIGFSAMMKPQGLLLVGAAPVLLAIRRRTSPVRDGAGSLLRDTLLAAAAASVVIGAVLGWVAWLGGWDAFVWNVTRYLPLYSRLDASGIERGSLLDAIAGSTIGLVSPSVVLYLVVLAGGWWFARSRLPAEQRRAVDMLGVLAVVGILHAWSGFKLWRYHFALFETATLAVLGAVAFAFVQSSSRRWGPQRARRFGRAFCLALAGLGLLVVVQAIVAPSTEVESVTRIDERTRSAAAALREAARPGDTVQILDTYDAGMNTALRAEVPPANRFIYDFYFFHDLDDPVIVGMRRELIHDFDAAPPRFVLFSKVSWSHRVGYDDVTAFPELAERLGDYEVLWEDEGMRLLQRIR